MLRFMLYMPNRDELTFFMRPSFTKAMKDAKAWLQMASDPYEGLCGETRAHLYIANGNKFEYIRTLWVQWDDVHNCEIDQYEHLNPDDMFKGCLL